MASLLAGKVCLITGGVTGIGRAIALEYLKQGAWVTVNMYPDPKSAIAFQEMQREVGEDAQDRLMFVAGDVASPDTSTEMVAKTVERFGRLDVFVSNAGVCQFAGFLEYVLQVWSLLSRGIMYDRTAL